MITREDIGELAQFESPEGCALSFYYQPPTPQNKSHREEVILVKDLVRNALHESERQGKNGFARADLDRILEMAEHLHGNQGRAKAVFACGAEKFWKEFNLPARLPESRLFLSQRFHLRPLTAIADVLPRVGIALVDRTKARMFDLWMDELKEREKIVTELPRRGRSDGFLGYQAGHAERHVDHEAMHHLKKVADRILELQESKMWDKVIIGCRDETWAELETQLHKYTQQKLIGRFTLDIATATPEQVRSHAEAVLKAYRENRYQNLIREIVGEAGRNGRGALGLRRVLRSLQTGEVQTLLIGKSLSASATECRNCNHIDLRPVKVCSVCNGETRELTDVADALLTFAVRTGIEIIHIGDNPEFEKIGNVAALLRFRADQNTNTFLQQAI